MLETAAVLFSGKLSLSKIQMSGLLPANDLCITVESLTPEPNRPFFDRLYGIATKHICVAACIIALVLFGDVYFRNAECPMPM